LTERKEKPYYLRQPWDILFKENKLENVSPWDVNLVQLLTSLLKEMERVGIDYRIAGTAVNSSVYIYLKKLSFYSLLKSHPHLRRIIARCTSHPCSSTFSVRIYHHFSSGSDKCP